MYASLIRWQIFQRLLELFNVLYMFISVYGVLFMLQKLSPLLGAKLIQQTVRSQVLADNRAGVIPDRPLTIYMPEQSTPNQLFPVLYLLAPWTSAGREQFAWSAFRESVFDQLTRLIAEKKIPPVIVVCPDLYTAFGGSQYINSPYLGLHGDFIVSELVPYIEANFPVKKGPEYRGVFGRSSGGFGAVRLAMDYPGVFSAVACHSGDLGFDTSMRGDLLSLCKTLSKYKNDVEVYLDYCRNAPKLGGHDVHTLMLLGLAASYSPNLHTQDGFDLPIDLYTGLIDEDIWGKWLSHDPVHRIKTHAEGLKSLNALYVECGRRDQFNLLYGARQFKAALDGLNISLHYEEFDDNHSGTSYRYATSLPIITKHMWAN